MEGPESPHRPKGAIGMPTLELGASAPGNNISLHTAFNQENAYSSARTGADIRKAPDIKTLKRDGSSSIDRSRLGESGRSEYYSEEDRS